MKKLFLLLLLTVGFVACETGSGEDAAELQLVDYDSMIDEFVGGLDTTSGKSTRLDDTQCLNAAEWAGELDGTNLEFGSGALTYYYWVSRSKVYVILKTSLSYRLYGGGTHASFADAQDALELKLIEKNAATCPGPVALVDGEEFSIEDLSTYGDNVEIDLGIDPRMDGDKYVATIGDAELLVSVNSSTDGFIELSVIDGDASNFVGVDVVSFVVACDGLNDSNSMDNLIRALPFTHPGWVWNPAHDEDDTEGYFSHPDYSGYGLYIDVSNVDGLVYYSVVSPSESFSVRGLCHTGDAFDAGEALIKSKN